MMHYISSVESPSTSNTCFYWIVMLQIMHEMLGEFCWVRHQALPLCVGTFYSLPLDICMVNINLVSTLAKYIHLGLISFPVPFVLPTGRNTERELWYGVSHMEQYIYNACPIPGSPIIDRHGTDAHLMMVNECIHGVDSKDERAWVHWSAYAWWHAGCNNFSLVPCGGEPILVIPLVCRIKALYRPVHSPSGILSLCGIFCYWVISHMTIAWFGKHLFESVGCFVELAFCETSPRS